MTRRLNMESIRLLAISILFLVLMNLVGCGINLPPEANAGPNRTVNVGEVVELNGKASWDPNGDDLIFEWSMITVPDNSIAILEHGTDMTSHFTADKKGNYIVQLVVNDGESYSSRDIVTIVAKNEGESDTTPSAANHYNGLNTACAYCHNGTSATGKTANHIMSTDNCLSCHFEMNTAFQPVPADTWVPKLVNHVEVLGTCVHCHQPPALHIELGVLQQCETCHDVSSWLQPFLPLPDEPGIIPPPFPVADPSGVNTRFDHTGIVDGCITCHNAVNAPGKSASHIAVADKCENCHARIRWVPVVRIDHTEVIGKCDSCHNGTIATGKPFAHVATTNACAGCHATLSWRPVITVDHGLAIGSCTSCHTKSDGHPAFEGECDQCHSTVVWRPLLP